MSAAHVAATWIRSQLAASTTITNIVSTRIYNDGAEQGALTPYIITEWRSSQPTSTQNGIRILTIVRMRVYGVQKGINYSGDLQTLVDAIETQLHRQSGNGSGGTVLQCLSDGDYRFAPPMIASTQYRYAGHDYELLVQES